MILTYMGRPEHQPALPTDGCAFRRPIAVIETFDNATLQGAKVGSQSPTVVCTTKLGVELIRIATVRHVDVERRPQLLAHLTQHSETHQIIVYHL